MCVTDIVREQNLYENDQWVTAPGDITESIDKYNNDMKRFLSYLWGIAVTSQAQYDLFTGIYALGDDYVYSDTDSVKVLNARKHMDYFERYNRNVTEKMRVAMEHFGFPFERTCPKTIKGIPKPLGVWDWETDDTPYFRFKTLGAKRYMTEHNGKISITVSGVNKKKAVPYLIKKHPMPWDTFKAFSHKLKIPAEYTGKLTHSYFDTEIEGELKDYTGKVGHYHELSWIHLEPCEYSLSLTDAYIDLIMGFEERNK